MVVHFSDGVTLTSGPLVDVFAISDPNYGDFADECAIRSSRMPRRLRSTTP